MAAEFVRHVLAALRLVFVDARPGNTLDTSAEGDIEQTPLRIECEEFSGYPDLFNLLPAAEQRGREAGDSRPVATVVRRRGQDPIVNITLRDFVMFCELNLFAPAVDSTEDEE